MKIWHLSFCALLLSAGSCRQTSEVIEGAHLPFAIDLQTGFVHDTVHVSVDNRSVFEDTVTTTPLLGLARRIPAQIGVGIHTVSVSILSQHVTEDTSFMALDTLVIGVTFNPPARDILFTFHHFWISYP